MNRIETPFLGPDVAGALSDVNANVGRALAAIAAVDLEHRVLEPESGEVRRQRRFIEERQLGPAVCHVARSDRRRRFVIVLPRPGVHTTTVRAGETKGRGDAGLVPHADQEQSRAAFDQRRRRGALHDAHTAFGVDGDVEQHERGEGVVDEPDGARFVALPDRAVERLVRVGREWLSERCKNRLDATHLLGERLQGDRGDFVVRRAALCPARILRGGGQRARCAGERREKRNGGPSAPVRVREPMHGHEAAMVPRPVTHAALLRRATSGPPEGGHYTEALAKSHLTAAATRITSRPREQV